MRRYVLSRLAWTAVVLWAIASLTFAATFLSPIDPARSYAGLRAPERVVENVRREFGLDRPLYVQYWRYFERLGHGDLGVSFITDQPVRDEVASRLPKTGLLAAAAVVVQLTIGLPLGVAAALKRRRATDRLILGFTLVGVVTPTFVLGFLLLYLFAFKLGWFPIGGSDTAEALVLPALTLGIAGAAWYARMMRSAVLNIVGEDFVNFARAKGMPERIVVLRHVLRNAVSPIIAMIGADLGVFLGGVLIIERVFAWPGIGDLAWQAISFNDVPTVMGTVLVAAFFVTAFNLVADLVNVAIDPRVKYA